MVRSFTYRKNGLELDIEHLMMLIFVIVACAKSLRHTGYFTSDDIGRVWVNSNVQNEVSICMILDECTQDHELVLSWCNKENWHVSCMSTVPTNEITFEANTQNLTSFLKCSCYHNWTEWTNEPVKIENSRRKIWQKCNSSLHISSFTPLCSTTFIKWDALKKGEPQ